MPTSFGIIKHKERREEVGALDGGSFCILEKLRRGINMSVDAAETALISSHGPTVDEEVS